LEELKWPVIRVGLVRVRKAAAGVVSSRSSFRGGDRPTQASSSRRVPTARWAAAEAVPKKFCP
jgi:hypothetical protein